MITFDPHLASKLKRGTKSDVMNRAYRLRQGFIGATQSCLCDFPVRLHETNSQHDERCPAHAIIQSMLEVEGER